MYTCVCIYVYVCLYRIGNEHYERSNLLRFVEMVRLRRNGIFKKN